MREHMDNHSNRGPLANPFWRFFDYEYRAYQSESYVDRGLGVRTNSPRVVRNFSSLLVAASQDSEHRNVLGGN